MTSELHRKLNEPAKIFQVFALMIFFPVVLFYWIAFFWPTFLRAGYYSLVSLQVFQSALAYWFATSVFSRKEFKPQVDRQTGLLRATFIVSAYLPNELGVIEATLKNLLENIQRPPEGIEIIVAYNTPQMEVLELILREWAYQYPEIVLANAHGSRSKSENLNYAIDLASGQMCVLLDADHLVAPDCLWRAWRWLCNGYDIVQGRCKIRNGADTFITRLIEIEFEIIYSIYHSSKSVIFDTALFGGSNGYWRTETIRKTRFKEDMLTEDIDSSLRSTLAGARIVHDRTIVSSELAPTRLQALWFQRKRWAQGWFQCSFKYQMDVWRSGYLNPAQKFLWTSLLSWRVIYDVSTVLLMPIILSYWLCMRRISLPMDTFIAASIVFTLSSGPYQTLAAYKNSVSPRPPLWQYFYYALAVWFYTLFKTAVHLVAISDELSGEKKWIVSKRT